MSETTTQTTASGETETGGQPGGSGDSGSGGTTTPPADQFAQREAHLETQRREQQARADRAEAELARLRAAQTPAAPAPTGDFLTKDAFREELRRQRELDSAVGALREKFPFAGDVFDRVDSFDNVEALSVAAENAHQRVAGLLDPAVQAAVNAAIKPYVDRYGALQQPPAGTKPGEGEGLPTAEEIARMSLAELDALEVAHPGHAKRVVNEAFSR